MKFLLLVLIVVGVVFPAKTVKKKPLPAPTSLSITWAEQALDIFWDSLPGVVGYNLYTSPEKGLPKEKKRKINPSLITSGPHFTYLWDIVEKKHERRVKGFRHCISVVAVYDTLGQEGNSSKECCTDYFAGFSNITDSGSLENIFLSTTKIPPLPSGPMPTTRLLLKTFVAGKGALLAKELKKRIDPKETGACMPITTIVVKLLKEEGIDAVRAEGRFIKEFHAFAVVNIEGVEYILDYAADQFLPGVAPVIMPRDFCFLTSEGKPGKEGLPIYLIEKLAKSGDANLADNEEAKPFRMFLDSLKLVH